MEAPRPVVTDGVSRGELFCEQPSYHLPNGVLNHSPNGVPHYLPNGVPNHLPNGVPNRLSNRVSNYLRIWTRWHASEHSWLEPGCTLRAKGIILEVSQLSWDLRRDLRRVEYAHPWHLLPLRAGIYAPILVRGMRDDPC